MADSAEIYRNAVKKIAASGVGLRSDQPTTTLANQKMRGQASDVYAMPVDGTGWQPLQVMDPGDANFGLFYFLPDYSVPGGPDVVR